ncbi:MAG: HAMP domain-containing histidine kinase [Oscillospiraceae bacterium]|nr:HAMP domain-containing histidine kinase [Oscillospiraceae bacterium]
MKKLNLRTQLSAGFAAIVFIVIALISVSANLLIRSRFEAYMESEQARLAKELADELANQYDAAAASWNTDYIHGVGMYAVNDGYFLKVLDTERGTVWDIEQHDMDCCKEMMDKISSDMERLRNSGGSFVSHEYPMYQGQALIGYAEIMYYTPYYANENAFHFLYSLNLILVVIGIVSMIGAVITGLIFARRITSPVSRVISRTRRIAGGDYSADDDNNAGSAEMQELSQAVTAMAQTLDRQEKLRTRLTGDVAHELRTPLTNIASHLEMMCEGIWEPTPERLTSCYEEIQRISGLVDDMEKLHRIDAEQLILNKTVFDIRPLIGNIVSLFENETAAKGLTVERSCGDISVCADRDRIAQVVTNLLSNAVKYTEKGGHIRIIAESSDDHFRLTVKDTGIGIMPDDLPHVFERFYRADKSRNRSTGGSGVGLAVAKAIIDAHGGTITAESEYGKGSEFTFSLPGK